MSKKFQIERSEKVTNNYENPAKAHLIITEEAGMITLTLRFATNAGDINLNISDPNVTSLRSVTISNNTEQERTIAKKESDLEEVRFFEVQTSESRKAKLAATKAKKEAAKEANLPVAAAVPQ